LAACVSCVGSGTITGPENVEVTPTLVDTLPPVTDNPLFAASDVNAPLFLVDDPIGVF
jgi:hypothetical protein